MLKRAFVLLVALAWCPAVPADECASLDLTEWLLGHWTGDGIEYRRDGDALNVRVSDGAERGCDLKFLKHGK